MTRETINEVLKFRDDRNWKQFHNPKDLAISISLEAAELLEVFQWSATDVVCEEKMDKIREENRSLQRERSRLVAQYFEEGYLDDSPVCNVCSGSGYVGAAMCECLKELCRLYEVMADYYYCDNIYQTDPNALQRYYDVFYSDKTK